MRFRHFLACEAVRPLFIPHAVVPVKAADELFAMINDVIMAPNACAEPIPAPSARTPPHRPAHPARAAPYFVDLCLQMTESGRQFCRLANVFADASKQARGPRHRRITLHPAVQCTWLAVAAAVRASQASLSLLSLLCSLFFPSVFASFFFFFFLFFPPFSLFILSLRFSGFTRHLPFFPPICYFSVPSLSLFFLPLFFFFFTIIVFHLMASRAGSPRKPGQRNHTAPRRASSAGIPRPSLRRRSLSGPSLTTAPKPGTPPRTAAAALTEVEVVVRPATARWASSLGLLLNDGWASRAFPRIVRVVPGQLVWEAAAGVHEGDELLAVDGASLQGLDVDACVAKLRAALQRARETGAPLVLRVQHAPLVPTPGMRAFLLPATIRQ